MPDTRRFLLPVFVVFLSACGGSGVSRNEGPPTEGVGVSGSTAGDEVAARADDAIELALRRVDGTFLDVGDLRGEVVVLYVFATFDGVSQMLLHPLRQIAERHPDVRIVGIAAQPSARLLVDAYVHALHPPFDITYDPSDAVQSGDSVLGPISVVPLLIVLNPAGAEVERQPGFVQVERIEEMVAAAR